MPAKRSRAPRPRPATKLRLGKANLKSDLADGALAGTGRARERWHGDRRTGGPVDRQGSRPDRQRRRPDPRASAGVVRHGVRGGLDHRQAGAQRRQVRREQRAGRRRASGSGRGATCAWQRVACFVTGRCRATRTFAHGSCASRSRRIPAPDRRDRPCRPRCRGRCGQGVPHAVRRRCLARAQRVRPRAGVDRRGDRVRRVVLAAADGGA